MKHWLAAPLLVTAALGSLAADSFQEQLGVGSDPAPLVQEGGVIVTPVPMPGAVIETVMLSNGKLPGAKKLKQAKKLPLPVVALTRTERRQMALLAVANQSSDDNQPAHQADDQDDTHDYDELVLHRSYSRPRVAETNDDDEPDVAISEHARIRLMMARLKAVEALALAQVEDDGAPLPERVTSRLAQAREMALAAHAKRYA